MRITDVETSVLRIPTGDAFGDARATVSERFWVVVELDTDVGLRGTGWFGTWRVPDLYREFVDGTLAEVVVDRDPFETGAIRAATREKTQYYPGEVGFSAPPRGAIDVALWDLKAKAADQPLYRFLGGDEPSARAYVSRLDARRDEADLATLHGDYADAGFTAFKTKLGGRSPSAEAARVETVREAVGPDADVLVDANGSWTVDETVRTLDRLEPHDVTWVEEPVPAYDIEGYCRLADRVRPAVAGGEMLYRPERFADLLTRGRLGVAQPDLARCGGVSGLLDVARLAESHGARLAPHVYYPVAAHLVSAAPSGWLVEYIPEYDAGDVLENAPRIEDGRVHLSEAPGHGYAVSDDARAEYGYET
ncbi:mandelate racemase/muconate lactonizing enzyme family protein [Halobium salinum]|uniref:Mandelate racemase/muconate lactonizing enzyme family protein n=1 Tax=Halobium salinum TaxID=1364940 RepID=A0ABD5PHE6_9EURY|nr:mandelate racemase/muconate lactonizing enzyme family protein [Halobium salinum]